MKFTEVPGYDTDEEFPEIWADWLERCDIRNPDPVAVAKVELYDETYQDACYSLECNGQITWHQDNDADWTQQCLTCFDIGARELPDEV
jgi:hypothetical protein